MTLKNKFKIVEKLFETLIYDSNHKVIDYKRYKRDHESSLYELPLAYAIANRFFKKEPIYKSDLQYCNKIIKSLVKIVGLNEKKITPDYIKTVLIFSFDTNDAISTWIDSYKKLINYINNKRI